MTARLRSPLAVVLLAAAYVGAAKVGFLAAAAHAVVSSVWPPTGLAVAALLLLGRRVWPGVALGAFIANAASGIPLAGAIGIAAGNTLEALVAVWLLRRSAFDPALERLRDVLALAVLAGVVSTTVSATIGVSSLWLSGAAPAAAYGTLWLVWWSGDVIGVLVVAPALLTWVTPHPRPARRRITETVAVLLALAALTAGLARTGFGYVYAVLPVATWAAYRLGPRGAAAATLVVSALAVAFTVGGVGPFGASTPTHNLFLLQTFMALLAMTTLGFAAATAERRRAERELSASRAKFAKVFHANPSAIAIMTLDGKVIEVNQTFVGSFGYAGEEVIGRNVLELGLWREPTDRARVVEQLVRGGSVRDLELEFRTKAGEPRTVLYAADLIDLEGVPHVLALTSDVTERKRLEGQLLQSVKMEAVGRLAGGIAHDFNNILTAIMGYCDVVLDELPPASGARADITEIKVAVGRAAELTHQLLAFSRQQVLALRVLDLNALVAGMDNLLRRVIGEDVDLRAALAPDLGTVKADPGQVEQVIMNLAVNARDAMPSGGKLTLETANIELDETYARAHVPTQAGSYVMLAVSDTGGGMDEQTKARIFEPFFTTKEQGKGTGLGLATVYGIVKQSGGYIWVYSELGRGTTFKIYLPRVTEAAEVVAPAAPRPAAVRGTETILLVEDNETVRSLARRILESQGYTVLTAGGGTEALRLVSEFGRPIHLLVTDVVMPEMGGPALAQRLHAQQPELRVLYLSGYSDEAVVRNGLLDPGRTFLQKPYTAEALARRVREVLDGIGRSESGAPGPK